MLLLFNVRIFNVFTALDGHYEMREIFVFFIRIPNLNIISIKVSAQNMKVIITQGIAALLLMPALVSAVSAFLIQIL